ncbi:MAG: type II secretion system F family protein [Nocardioides sp.]
MTGMSGALLPALGGAMVVAGLIGIVVGFRKVPPPPPGPARRGALGRPGGLVDRVRSMSRTMRTALLVGFAVGVAVALLTGWLIAIIVLPAAVVGLPVLLSTPPSSARIDRLEAMEEWARSLSSGLTAGRGLDQALIKSLRSTPDVIRPEVARLVARLDAHWSTERALRAFAEDLDDATGDLLVYYLILSARRRGTGLASVLEEVAESVAADVRARRQIDADQAKPRTTARYVTVFTIGVLGFLALTGEYIEPYGSPLGQVVLALLLTAYVATLVWMRSMATAKPLPRFLNNSARDSSRGASATPRQPVTSVGPREPAAVSARSAGVNGKAVTR